MSSQAYDFTTAKFDVSERGVVGSTSVGPVVKLKLGMALFRAMYEYRNAGLSQGELDTVPDQPGTILAAMNAATRFSIAPGASTTAVFPDENTTANYDFLDSSNDAMECTVIAIDASYTTGDVACPEIKTWCEALGGTYGKILP